MRILLLDVGSTNVKHGVYDTVKRGLSIGGFMPFPPPTVLSGHVYEVACGLIDGVIDGIIRSVAPVDGIMLSVQMHGYILRRKSGGFNNYVSWRDVRSLTDGKFFKIKEQIGGLIGPESGTALKPNLSVASICADGADTGAVSEYFTLGSYIFHGLTGINAAHITDCAASGLFAGAVPNAPLLQKLGFGFKLPAVRVSLQSAAGKDGFAVYPPVGDQQASVYAAVKSDESPYVINIGTAAQICTVSSAPWSGGCETRPYFGGKYLLTVTGLPGGKDMSPGNPAGTADRYVAALESLPRRKSAVFIGGAIKYHGETVKAIADAVGLPCAVKSDISALDGLRDLYTDAHKGEPL
jgi:hypothetical protein